MQVELSKRRPDLQVYAHRKNGELSKSVTVLALNNCRDEIVALDFGRNSLDVFLCTADDVMGRDVLLNGRMLETRADGSVPEFEPTIIPSGILDLPPVSYAFIPLDMQ